jgi:hypothetical protein
MFALLAKLAELAGLREGERRREAAAVRRATASALTHLEGVRNAPPGDSQMYLDEKEHLGRSLQELIEAASAPPGDRFKAHVLAGRRVKDAVVIRGERLVDPYIEELERLP